MRKPILPILRLCVRGVGVASMCIEALRLLLMRDRIGTETTSRTSGASMIGDRGSILYSSHPVALSASSKGAHQDVLMVNIKGF